MWFILCSYGEEYVLMLETLILVSEIPSACGLEYGFQPMFNKASFWKNCLGGLLARLIQVLDTTDVCLVAS